MVNPFEETNNSKNYINKKGRFISYDIGYENRSQVPFGTDHGVGKKTPTAKPGEDVIPKGVKISP